MESSSNRQPSEVTSDAFQVFQEMMKASHSLVLKALEKDESFDDVEALALYEKSHKLLTEAIQFDINHCLPTERSKAMQMLEQMKSHLCHVDLRLQEIRSSNKQAESASKSTHLSALDQPPSYEDVVVQDSMNGQQASTPPAEDAEELFVIEADVQIYFISPDGFVSAPSYPSSLHIYRFTRPTISPGDPQAFIQVDNWTYPLVAGESPVLSTFAGQTYLFPSVEPGAPPGSAVGVMLPPTLTDEQRALFESLLKQLCQLRTQVTDSAESTQAASSCRAPPPRPPPPPVNRASSSKTDVTESDQKEGTATVISQGIQKAAEWCALGLRRGSEITSQWLSRGGEQLRNNLAPQTTETPVDRRLQTGAAYTRTATKAVVKVSGFVVSALGKATQALAQQAAPKANQLAKQYLPSSATKTGSSSVVKDAATVVAGGVKGFGTVYLGLEEAAKSLGRAVIDETSSTVTHKYGAAAGKLTDDVLYSGGNLALATHNFGNLGVKAIAKRTAKDMGKEMFSDLAKKDSVDRDPDSREPEAKQSRDKQS